MTEEQRKAFDFAADATKQIITLCTAIIAVSVTLAGNAIGGGPSWLIGLSWVFFLLAILFGIFTLNALTGNMATDKVDIFSSNIKIPALCQSLFFLIALILTSIVGYHSMNKISEKNKTEKIIIESRVNHNTSSIDTIIYKNE